MGSNSTSKNIAKIPSLQWIDDKELPPHSLKLIDKILKENGGYCLSIVGHLIRPLLSETEYRKFDVNSSQVVDKLYSNEERTIFAMQHEGKLRIWLPAEIKLISQPHSIALDESGRVEQVSFPTEELTKLYLDSCQLLEDVLRDSTIGGPLIGSLSRIWVPSIVKTKKIEYYNPCQKWFIKATSQSIKDYDVPKFEDSDIYWSTLKPEDVDTVRGNNALKFDPEYVKRTFGLSSCLRMKKDDSLVCWAMTHWDLAISSLHTLKDHRRKGYAKAVLFSLINKHIELCKSRGIEEESIWLHADIESYNTVSTSFFQSCGFNKALDNLWIVVDD